MSFRIGEAIQVINDVEFKSAEGEVLDTKVGDIAIITGDKKLYFISGNSKGLIGCLDSINVSDKYDTKRIAEYLTLSVQDTLSNILCSHHPWPIEEDVEKDYKEQLKQAIEVALSKIF